jgi:hypothetical protein
MAFSRERISESNVGEDGEIESNLMYKSIGKNYRGKMLDLNRIKSRYAREIQSLSQIFTDHDLDFLAMFLVECDYDIEVAITRLASSSVKARPHSMSNAKAAPVNRALIRHDAISDKILSNQPYLEKAADTNDILKGVGVPGVPSDSIQVPIVVSENTSRPLYVELQPVIFPVSTRPSLSVLSHEQYNFRIVE